MVWIVDPIDGTVNFLYGIPHYSVSIAAALDGDPVAGVVVNVESGERFTATKGGGSFQDGVRLRVGSDGSPPPCRSGWWAPASTTCRRQGQADRRGLRDAPRGPRRPPMGSAALDLCSVACGRVDAYVEEGLNVWDMAAGGLVATEAGAPPGRPPGWAARLLPVRAR